VPLWYAAAASGVCYAPLLALGVHGQDQDQETHRRLHLYQGLTCLRKGPSRSEEPRWKASATVRGKSPLQPAEAEKHRPTGLVAAPLATPLQRWQQAAQQQGGARTHAPRAR
jgi:hypothetical protein